MGCPVQCPRNPITKDICSGRGQCSFSGYDFEDTNEIGTDVIFLLYFISSLMI